MEQNMIAFENSLNFSNMLINSEQTLHNKSILQTCYYHLNNVQKQIEENPNNKLLTKKSEKRIIFPKISDRKDFKIQCTSILNNSNFQVQNISQNKLVDKSRKQFKLSITKEVLNTYITSKQTEKQINNLERQHRQCLKKPKHYHLYQQKNSLKKQERYFQDQLVKINEKQVQSLGLLEAANIYKPKNITNFLKEMHPIIIRKKLDITKCKKGQLFLTNPTNYRSIEKSMENFLKKEIVDNSGFEQRNKSNDQAHKQNLRNNKKIEFNKKQRENYSELNNQSCEIKHQQSKQIAYHVTISNYKLQKNQSYKLFKNNYHEQWSEFLTIINQLCKYLKKMKISSLKVRADKLIKLWVGKKITHALLQEIVKVKVVDMTKQQLSHRIYLMWTALIKIREMHKKNNREKSLMRWVITRFKGKKNIKRSIQIKIQKAHYLHENILQMNNWQIQVHVPSFSETQFIRNTTQYMQEFENNFLSIWNKQSLHLIIVLPVVNESLLKFMQTKLKINKNITIICPQIHHLYPQNMSLAGYLYNSYQALNRIKNLIKDKQAVLVPGRCKNLNYQFLISEYLNIPLLTTYIQINNQQICLHKQIFEEYQIKTPAYSAIAPHSTKEQLIEKLAILIIKNPKIKKWIFKLNGQFNGRGLAEFSASTKFIIEFLKQQRNQNDKPDLITHLEKYLNLKLEVVFKNCLFRTDQFIVQILKLGGIIQAYVNDSHSYELNLKVHRDCEVQSCLQTYNVQYSTKVYTNISCNSLGKIQADLQNQDIAVQILPPEIYLLYPMVKNILVQKEFIGYVTISFLIENQEGSGNKNAYALEIKPYLTISSPAMGLIDAIQQKQERQTSLKSRGQIKSLTEFSSKYLIPTLSDFYLFIPNLLFTDVDQQIKAVAIDELVHECLIKSSKKFYISLGISLGLIVHGRNIKKMKKSAIEQIRALSQKIDCLRSYKGKQQMRDFFQYGDIIRAITQIKI